MTSDREQGTGGDLVATLISTAGRRADPPADAYRAVLAAAEDTWQRKVGRRRRWRVGVGIAAAFVLLTAGAGLLRTVVLPMMAPAEIARVDRVGGGVATRPAGAGAWVPLVAARLPLHAGTRLRTGPDGRVDLRLEGGVSLRLAVLTEIELRAPDLIRLQHGAVYADTGSAGPGGIVVVTPAGSARDIGTQFELRYAGDILRLRVREGRVSLQRDAGELIAAAGEQLTIDTAGGVTRGNIARDDLDWAWAETLAPVPDFNDQSVAVLLEWVARETGRPVRYADSAAEQRAAAVILHGRIGPLAPLEALGVLLSTTDLTYEILPDGTIEVRYQ
jgi:ferric-dicitrate binding protein FerR (iron transport regulator)